MLLAWTSSKLFSAPNSNVWVCLTSLCIRHTNLGSSTRTECKRKDWAIRPKGTQERFLQQRDANVDSWQTGRTLPHGSEKERCFRWLAQKQTHRNGVLISSVPSSQGINIPTLTKVWDFQVHTHWLVITPSSKPILGSSATQGLQRFQIIIELTPPGVQSVAEVYLDWRVTDAAHH